MELNFSGSNFAGLGIAPNLLDALERLQYKNPTPIQQRAIPIGIQGKDIVGIAQTGTGKTLAFGIPMIQRLHEIKARGLVLLPTRELALQVEESLQKIGTGSGLRIATLIGGAPMRLQIRALQRDPHIVVATPGRLNDHLEQKTIQLKNVRIVVLDEADRMLDMGFAPQIKKVFQTIPRDRQTMLFSATLPPKIMKMATEYMKVPIRIEVAPSGSTAEGVTQEIFVVGRDAKSKLLQKILDQYLGPTLIFTRTRYGAKQLTEIIHKMGHTVSEIHSNRSLYQRRSALEGFKTGKYRVLVATDIASRGIDVSNIELVINYDLPENAEDYVHRIGRTARAGARGHAISFVAPNQRRELRDIERLVKKTLAISQLPDISDVRIPQVSLKPHRFERPRRARRRRFYS